MEKKPINSLELLTIWLFVFVLATFITLYFKIGFFSQLICGFPLSMIGASIGYLTQKRIWVWIGAILGGFSSTALAIFIGFVFQIALIFLAGEA